MSQSDSRRPSLCAADRPGSSAGPLRRTHSRSSLAEKPSQADDATILSTNTPPHTHEGRASPDSYDSALGIWARMQEERAQEEEDRNGEEQSMVEGGGEHGRREAIAGDDKREKEEIEESHDKERS